MTSLPMNKTLCLALLGLLVTHLLFAQAPNKMNYQAVLRNASNALLSNQNIGMRISILQGSANGTSVYTETQTTTTDANGLASVEIGGGNALIGNFAGINWANGPYFIKTETDAAGGTNYNITSTQQLLSVPYALYAANAGTAAGGCNFTHYIGEQFGGGIIFHLWKDAQGVEHGLIVDKTDLSTGQVWSNIDQLLIGSSAQSRWDGLSNSTAIVGQAGHTNSAAALCLNSTNGGQSDWYLPSIQELNMLWNNYHTVARSLNQISGATQLRLVYYWSSTEAVSGLVWTFFFGYGHAYHGFKSYTYYVRAVRAF